MKFEKLSKCAEFWDTIFEQAKNSSPFMSYEWYHTLSNKLLKTDPEVILLSENSQPVGIFPVCIKNTTMQLIGDDRVTDINDVICLPGYECKMFEKIAHFVEHNRLHVDLFPIEPNSSLVIYLPQFLDAVTIDEADKCPLLFLPDSWDEYLALLSGKSRHELRRKLRKAVGAKLKTVEPEQIDILFKSMSISDKNKKNFLQPDMCEFFRALATSFHKKRWLRFRALFIDSRLIAVMFAFSFRKTVYLYNTGFEPEYGDLSPGIVTIGLDIQDAIDEGFRVYDFLRGAEEYKFRFGAQERSTVRVRL